MIGEWTVIGADRLTPEQILACIGARPLSSFRMVSLPVLGTALAEGPIALRDVCGRRRSAATLPGFRKGRKPGNWAKRYPPEPLAEMEMFALLQAFGTHPAGVRDRALTVVLWRSGLRISEALALRPHDLDPTRHTVHVQRGKGGKQRYSGMDPWAFGQVAAWLLLRQRYPVGPLFCTVEGPSKGGPMGSPQYRVKLKTLAAECGIQKNVRPHGLRHTHAVELAGEIPMHLVQRQLGHSSLATTANYLAGIAPHETWDAIAARSTPGAAS